jgi:dolichol-phosphate mannosyltransferase
VCSILPGSLGGAYGKAWAYLPTDWLVVHIDAGGSHDPADLYPMLELAEEGFDVVIGSRFCPGGVHHGTWTRRASSKFAAFMLDLISLSEIHDWTSGYRVYSPRARAILAAHDFTTTGHAWQIESLWVLKQAGCRVVEHPITYKASVSHLSRGRVQEAASLYWRLLWG